MPREKTYLQLYEKLKPFGFQQHRSLFQSSQYEILFDSMARIGSLDPAATILDWGGGQGHASLLLKEAGLSPTLFSLVDYPSRYRDLNKFGITTVYDAASPTHLPFENNQFSYSLSCGVLEHVKETGGDEIQSLRELARVTSKKIFLYHLPNQFSWIEYLNRRFRRGVYTHPFRYTRGDIEALVKATDGLRLVRCFRYGALPRRVGVNIKSYRLAKILGIVDKMLSRSILEGVSQNWFVEIEVTE